MWLEAKLLTSESASEFARRPSTGRINARRCQHPNQNRVRPVAKFLITCRQLKMQSAIHKPRRAGSVNLIRQNQAPRHHPRQAKYETRQKTPGQLDIRVRHYLQNTGTEIVTLVLNDRRWGRWCNRRGCWLKLARYRLGHITMLVLAIIPGPTAVALTATLIPLL